MSKVEEMDHYFALQGKKLNSSYVCEVVSTVFEIDLEQAPILNTVRAMELQPNNELSVKTVIDAYINNSIGTIDGEMIRKFINEVFGVNLNAISTLDEGRISIYSKNQWIVQNEQDLFIVHTSNKDVDIKILTTNYFKNQTKMEGIPNNLLELLTELGYTYNKNEGSCHYSNPSGVSIDDEFKGKTMAVISKVIQESFSKI